MTHIELKPYFVADGVPSMRDSDIAALYDRMAADGTLGDINYEGAVGDAAALVRVVKSARYFAVIRADGHDAGLVWLNRWQPRRAHLHFCLFSCAWGAGSDAIGRDVLARLFTIQYQGVPCLDMLWGVVPTANMRAAAYVEKCGGRIGCRLPNYIWNAALGRSEDGLLFYISRSDLEGKACVSLPG